jgi:hypothetical protein
MRFLLDIDGVMVPAKAWEQPPLLEDGFPAFSTKAVQAMAAIVNQTDTIVLTTSHKSRFSVEQWKRIFLHRGLMVGNIERLPENSSNLNRMEEILRWFELNGMQEAFLIIDDDKSLHGLPPFLKERWIETSSYVGLTPEHVPLASDP